MPPSQDSGAKPSFPLQPKEDQACCWFLMGAWGGKRRRFQKQSHFLPTYEIYKHIILFSVRCLDYLRFHNVFERSLLCSLWLHLFDPKCKKTFFYVVKYYYNFKTIIHFFFLYKYFFIYCMFYFRILLMNRTAFILKHKSFVTLCRNLM